MKAKTNILFLSFELSGYFVACVKNLVDRYNVKAHIIRYKVNSVAPFEFEDYPGIEYYERENFDRKGLQNLAKEISPELIVCSGWSDSCYVSVCADHFGKIPTVLSFDNPWVGSVKQWAYSFLAPFYFRKKFNHVWIPGEEHRYFAKKLGFKDDQIHDGLYSADFDHFFEQYKANKESKKANFPHKILFVGRFVEKKGVREMWKAFVEWQSEKPNDWELWCLGKGELLDEMPKHEQIKYLGFVQPDKISEIVASCGVFILPSQIEHWGVVVHEFAAAGYPLISSNATAAANFFLVDGYNGFMHEPKSKDSIKSAFQKLLKTSNEQLIEMGENSIELARKITTTTWSDFLVSLIDSENTLSNDPFNSRSEDSVNA